MANVPLPYYSSDIIEDIHVTFDCPPDSSPEYYPQNTYFPDTTKNIDIILDYPPEYDNSEYYPPPPDSLPTPSLSFPPPTTSLPPLPPAPSPSIQNPSWAATHGVLLAVLAAVGAVLLAIAVVGIISGVVGSVRCVRRRRRGRVQGGQAGETEEGDGAALSIGMEELTAAPQSLQRPEEAHVGDEDSAEDEREEERGRQRERPPPYRDYREPIFRY
ncbi:uncharacterized protein BDZ99DRAFT_557688 [Mytilinidion resinicola]|uniref:Uncharacterized protein n=1 Tax=Mytilinidion resinicola TaxID=574789 RepID=A0A6A6YU52_9PEZI|nr:uncharacterized protein BDZ99DRAFT_557688 [Mytilinidion resinicola]KAF2812059.1 hypothetical protein BDZ99DRAFT_557688 [Mytilinidion resinicola]